MTAKEELVELRHKFLKATKEKDNDSIMWRINDLDNFIYKYKNELGNIKQ